MKKLKVYNLFIFLLGLVCLSLGVVLVVKSNLGISVAMSVPYIFSLYFTKISFGQWSYIIQGITLILLFIIVKRVTVKYLLSFVVAFLFGIAIDLFGMLLISFAVYTFYGKLGVFILGSIVISIGVAAFIKSNYPIQPFDTFVKEVAIAKNIKYAKFKTGFDLTFFMISLTTLVSAIILGSMIGACLDMMNKYIDGKTILPEKKTREILDFDFLNLKKAKEFEQ